MRAKTRSHFALSSAYSSRAYAFTVSMTSSAGNSFGALSSSFAEAKSEQKKEVFDALPRRVQTALRDSALTECAVHADEPVTGDLHRLIRLPGTLHGGTGLLAQSVTLEELRTFDPYRQATALGDAPVKVRCVAGHQVAMGDVASLKPDEVAKLPAAQGAYFMARGFATLEIEA